MLKHILTAGAAFSVALCGCAVTPNEEASDGADVERHVSPSVVGLAMYHPQSDVADLTESVRHVLNPGVRSNDTSALRDLQRTERHSNVQYQIPERNPASDPVAVVVAQFDRKRDPVYEAWRKYCNNAVEVTPDEWAVIDRTTMPPELEAIWADECMPLK